MPTQNVNVRVRIKNKRFYREDSGFGIFVATVLEVYDKEDNPTLEYSYGNDISIKGTTGALTIGDEYIASLKYSANDKYKGNYEVLNIYQELPKDFESQKAYFKALLTPNQYQSLVEIYHGTDLIELFQSDQIDWKRVSGLGEKRYKQIREKILSSMNMATVIAFSEKFSIPVEIMKRYALVIGNPNLAIENISKNPYKLMTLDNIGFLRADKIAMKMGLDADSEFRIRAGYEHALTEANNNGDTWVKEGEMISTLKKILDIKESLIVSALEKFVADSDDDAIMYDGKYTKEGLLFAEAVIAKQLVSLVKNSKPFIKEDRWEKMVDDYCKKNDYELHSQQLEFLYNWNKYQINVLIGYGGTGKTFTQNVLIGILEENNLYEEFALLAPTGRASRVLADYTGKNATTIHRRLPMFEDMAGIDEAFVIVDESSMCDIFLSAQLVSIMVNPNVRILFVGDDFQIPSVGVGNFLYDIINSNAIPVTKLTKVFRQEDGGIKDISYKIRKGERFLLTGEQGRKQFGKDCVFWLAESKYLLNGVIKNYLNIRKKYEEEEILIISPTNKGGLGTVNINLNIQHQVNPQSSGKNEIVVKRGEVEIPFREGDLVLNTKNSYNLESVEEDQEFEIADDGTVHIEGLSPTLVDVFNGDIGKILSVDPEKRKMVIDFDGYKVEYTSDMIGQLMHGWCITIHKSQGSQAKAVIVVLDKSATFQLNANLVYTGVSRASEILLVLGQEKVINDSLRKFQNMKRKSFLGQLLKDIQPEHFRLGNEPSYRKDLILQEVYELKSQDLKKQTIENEDKKEEKWLYL